MPMREWLWHRRAVRDDHTSGKYHIILQYGQVSLGLSRKALPSSQTTCRVRAGRSTWPRGVLSPALLSFTLFLTIMAGRPNAQAPPPGPEPALAPAVPSPLETVPAASERILAPVP